MSSKWRLSFCWPSSVLSSLNASTPDSSPSRRATRGGRGGRGGGEEGGGEGRGGEGRGGEGGRRGNSAYSLKLGAG